MRRYDSAAGGAPTQVTTDPANDERPNWSPDGAQLFFDSDRSGNPDLWVVSSSGGTVTQLTSQSLLDRHADSSPDGTQIVYSSRHGGSADPELWLIPSGGGTPVLLHADVGMDDRFPAFSPDGSTVAFAKGGDIYLIPSSGGTPVQLTTHAALDLHPTWSPDGTMIAFQSQRSGNNDVWMIPTSGGTAIQVTTDPANDAAPDWSPTGDTIAFHSNRGGGASNDIWMLPSTGGTVLQITTDPGNDIQVDWAQNGSQIAFARDGNIWKFTFGVDLTVNKTVDDVAPQPGDTITYTIDITNNGPNAASGVEVTDLLPAGVTYQSDSPTAGSYASGTGLWTVGALADGATETLTITATVDAGTSGSTITNIASVTSVDQPESPNGNSASAGITVEVILTMSSAADQQFSVGDPSTPMSTITITDAGLTPTITAANDLRVRIPAGFNMDWDTTDVTATIGGTAAAKVSTTVSYEDAGRPCSST